MLFALITNFAKNQDILIDKAAFASRYEKRNLYFLANYSKTQL